MSRTRIVLLLLVGGVLIAAREVDPDLMKQAKAGDVEAQFVLGRAYSSGRGAPRNQHLAAFWWTKAGEQGDARAQVNLAKLYTEGKGVPKDDAEAVKWIFRAAESGHPRAQFLMGERFMKGDGVQRNLILAHMWMTLARSAGSASAQFMLTQLEKEMSAAQVAASKKLAKSWAKNRGSVTPAK